MPLLLLALPASASAPDFTYSTSNKGESRKLYDPQQNRFSEQPKDILRMQDRLTDGKKK